MRNNCTPDGCKMEQFKGLWNHHVQSKWLSKHMSYIACHFVDSTLSALGSREATAALEQGLLNTATLIIVVLFSSQAPNYLPSLYTLAEPLNHFIHHQTIQNCGIITVVILFNKYFEFKQVFRVKKLVGRRGAPELELLAVVIVLFAPILHESLTNSNFVTNTI